ncbi:hypothetical protein M3D75_02920 [Microbacterium enclense]|uniref:hypothetical protein n=1 Tax=Microbacterium enclense TaxID=993073 RepID=UPI0021A5F623|nr:hypothetical protein [Microbacterium enclense]MCT2085059.1 hypothetical protein [Microbacterium enclense]
MSNRKVIAEPKILPVVPGYLAGSADRVEVMVCTACAAVVFDPIQHDRFHSSLTAPAS